MVMSKEQREEHSYRMWCYWHKEELVKLMNNPELHATAEELIKNMNEEGGRHGKDT